MPSLPLHAGVVGNGEQSPDVALRQPVGVNGPIEVDHCFGENLIASNSVYVPDILPRRPHGTPASDVGVLRPTRATVNDFTQAGWCLRAVIEPGTQSNARARRPFVDPLEFLVDRADGRERPDRRAQAIDRRRRCRSSRPPSSRPRSPEIVQTPRRELHAVGDERLVDLPLEIAEAADRSCPSALKTRSDQAKRGRARSRSRIAEGIGTRCGSDVFIPRRRNGPEGEIVAELDQRAAPLRSA